MIHRRSFVSRLMKSTAALGIWRNFPIGESLDSSSAPTRFSATRDRYFLRFLQLNPVVSTYLGGDGYDPQLSRINGTLRNYDRDALGQERSFYQMVKGELGRLDQQSLTSSERIDYGVLQAQLAFLLHQIEDRRYFERCVDTYVAEPFRGVDWQLQQMQKVSADLLGSADEWELVLSRLRAIPGYLNIARENLRAGIQQGNRPDWRMVQHDGVEGSKANADYFGTTLLASARRYLGQRGFVSTFLPELEKAGTEAARAYTDFSNFLPSAYGEDQQDRFAAGEDEYNWRLSHCLKVNQTAAELYHYGADQVSLYQARMFEVAEEVARDSKLQLAFGSAADKAASVRRVMDHLAADSPASDDELFRWYREVGARAVAYGREHRLFDIPQSYQLDVVPTPPVLRSTIDAAYYPAPPFKHSGVGRFYLTPTNNDPATLRLNNRASVADTAVHEGFPGHDWHYKFMAQHAREISNIRWLTPGAVEDSSSMWEDSMAAEGWALYSEELMAEPVPGRPHGFYSAAEHLYELQGQLLRAVRVRIDVGIHTNRMSFDDAVNYFTEHVSFFPQACAHGKSDASARAVCQGAQRALYRYSKWPTQAITYNLGKNAIVRLRDAYRAKQGSAYSGKAFHEKLMAMGTIPAGYFHDSFLQDPPE
jgi:uncharacterized protein (DUF885 family)